MNRDDSVFHLSTGRTVRVTNLRQFEVYAGVLFGSPDAQLTKRLLEKAVEEERQATGDKPYVIKPDLSDQGARLPRVASVVRLTCAEPVRETSGDFSELSVIWFQDAFGFPPDDEVVASLKAIVWDDLASDYQY